MWSSTTLPRSRPMDPPPPPPPHKATTLQRHSSKSVDVNKLKNDIEMLSKQLEIVKARLESALSENDGTDSGTIRSRDDSTDSRLSTALFSSPSQESCGHTPTPQPTEATLGNSHQLQENFGTHKFGYLLDNDDFLKNRRFIGLCKPLSLSASHLVQIDEQKQAVKRLSVCLPHSSKVMNSIKRRETFSKIDEITKEVQNRIAKVKRTESLSMTIGRNPPVPPPKPNRTFLENSSQINVLEDGFKNHTLNKTKAHISSYSMSSIAFLSMCSHREFVDAINKRFTQGQCWFSRGGQLFFVNPFNDISTPQSSSYSVIPTITSSLFETRDSSIFLRGVSGSGKSHIAEMICIDIVNRYDTKGSLTALLKHALNALRPFISANSAYNNQCSKMALHYYFQTRENRLTKIQFRHFPIEAISRGCRANIFAIVANDLKEEEKVALRISGFRLRENTSVYGEFDDIRNSLTILGVNVSDILKIVAACILLNNISFNKSSSCKDIDNLADMEDASALLGISALALYKHIVTESTAKNLESRVVRDNFVIAIYSRMIHFLIERINIVLDNFSDSYDQTSVVTDSGISVGTSNEINHNVHVIDLPGYIRGPQNSLNELLVNSLNDIIQCTDSDAMHEFLRSVDSATKPKTMKHCAENFEVNYDYRSMIERNLNVVKSELVFLFDYRSCTFPFAVSLFENDIEKMIIEPEYSPSAINWPFDGKTIIQRLFENIHAIKMETMNSISQQIICLKSNESLEYAKIHDNGLGYQLSLYRTVASNSCSSSMRPKSTVSQSRAFKVPPPRSYAIRAGTKHYFPQRRNILIDFQDSSTGVMLRAGEIVKALGFSGECYLVETSRRSRAIIPMSFTEKSVIPKN
ncbi:unnamed protein product [Caenorhabditis bovis]|uniref:Myosin motor domain-containing protein n=1 Tax=Caenorhabditis bovis TaxID=2654633 RepID=A0A8S1EL84_9PELO|nr:unnamed protein product [Caenorhabditis bovis]